MPQPRGARRARNDERILAAARAVFVADPSAPIAAVARHAGVGMSALYARYASKEDLLRALCADGLRRTSPGGVGPRGIEDPWERFVAFLRAAVEADASTLTQRLAGTFVPTPEPLRRRRAGRAA